ncbi:MAG TPA: SUMF1/EgtB/PvdO family nonheme iron enzyme, partial [Thermoleophilaceae bacterium]
MTSASAVGPLARLADVRTRTLELVEPLSDSDAEAVHSPLMSPLAWDLGHIAAFEDLWLVHRAAGEPLLRPGLAEIYDALETPRAHRGELQFLGRSAALDYLAEVRGRVEELAPSDVLLQELVIQHELQHNETMLQTLALARLDGYVPPGYVSPADQRLPQVEQRTPTGLETVVVPPGAFELGAPAGRFSYDNERPRHTTDVPAFEIGRVPVTNGAFGEWIAAGGYARREWWSEAGWEWRRASGVERPGSWFD